MDLTVGQFDQGYGLDTYLYASAFPLTSGVDLEREQDYRLFMEQQPQIGLVTSKKRDLKPIDPPPVIRIEVSSRKDPTGVYLLNPYCFMICRLKKITKAESGETQEEIIDRNKMSGGIVSSLHQLRNAENRDVGYFVFADIYPKEPGEYRLLFTLHEMDRQGLEFFVELATIESETFPVWPIESFPGLEPSTCLTRSISTQGVRLRLRKNTGKSQSKRMKRRISLTGAEDRSVWQHPCQHPTVLQLGGSPTTWATDSASTRRAARNSHWTTHPLQCQQYTSLGFTDPIHADRSMTASMNGYDLSGIPDPQPPRDSIMQLNNASLRLYTPQYQSQFLNMPYSTAWIGGADLYNFSSNPVLNQGSQYSAAVTDTISTLLPLRYHHHHLHYHTG